MRKVERNIEKYELEQLNNELHQRHQDGASLRDLASFINKQILEKSLEKADTHVVCDTDSLYEILRGDEVSVGKRAAVSAQLTQHGVPMDDVEDDFVSHQTVSDHLRTCLNRDTARSSQVTVKEAEETLGWAQSRCTAVIERTLDRLHAADYLEADNLDVAQTALVTCGECNQSYSLHEFIENGGCSHSIGTTSHNSTDPNISTGSIN